MSNNVTPPLVGHFIDGKTYDGSGLRRGDVYDPATGEVTKQVAFAEPEDVDAAVASASEAFLIWRSTLLAKRSQVLFSFREAVNHRRDELAAIVTSEHGKVRADALGEVRPEMSLYSDEIFGPILSVLRASEYNEALALVNANPYRNGTAIFTNDGGAARRFEDEVEVGMVGINVPIPVPVAYYSFGGWKNSLFGDSHAYGPDAVHFFTRNKVVTSRWLNPSHGGLNLGFPRNS